MISGAGTKIQLKVPPYLAPPLRMPATQTFLEGMVTSLNPSLNSEHLLVLLGKSLPQVAGQIF